MKASEAQEITNKYKNHYAEFSELIWLEAMRIVYLEIKRMAQLGNSKAEIDLRKSNVDALSRNLQRFESELKTNGYEVVTVLDRTPNGARKATIKW